MLVCPRCHIRVGSILTQHLDNTLTHPLPLLHFGDRRSQCKQLGFQLLDADVSQSDNVFEPAGAVLCRINSFLEFSDD